VSILRATLLSNIIADLRRESSTLLPVFNNLRTETDEVEDVEAEDVDEEEVDEEEEDVDEEAEPVEDEDVETVDVDVVSVDVEESDDDGNANEEGSRMLLMIIVENTT
jgi:hypothetical protein